MSLRNIYLLVLIFWSEMGKAQDAQLIQRLKERSKTEKGISKVNILNDLVDEILQPKPGNSNCTAAKVYALEGSKLSEELNYNLGMARSFEQLSLIYKILDNHLLSAKWKYKAALVPHGPTLRKQQEELNKQREELAKLGIKIQHQTLELQEKEFVIDSTADALVQLSADKKVVVLENELLQKENRIAEIETDKQKLKSRLLIAILSVFLILSGILFFLFRSRHKLANELVAQNIVIENEKRRSDELLLNILPHEIANELKTTGKSEPKYYKSVTIMFTDFKDFTLISEKLTPKELVSEIDHCFSAFDMIIEKYGMEKIKTIGDAYLCAYGINNAKDKDHGTAILAAKEILLVMDAYKKARELEGKPGFEIRIGLHTGAVVAGVVGKHKFAYDIWGDAVNTAARMEQNSEAGKINISAVTYEIVKNDFKCEHRGKVLAKNKGEIDMYFLAD